MREALQTVMFTLEEQVDPKHSALVIVDVQNDFVHDEGLFAKLAGSKWKSYRLIPRMLEHLPRLLEAARQSDMLITFVRGISEPRFISEPYAFIQQRKGIYGKVTRANTFGSDFYGDIRPNESQAEFVVTKHRYSGFWGTDLDMVLRSNGIKTVVMTGTATSGCVDATARDAFFNDYYVVTVEDCCGEKEETQHKATLEKLDRSFGYVVNSEDLIKVWDRRFELTNS